jgi:heat shock protein HslJ/uncharacterized lipoprotein NlpE involved in copper resistance
MRTRHLLWILALVTFVVSGCQRAQTRGQSDDSAGHLVLPATYKGTMPCADCPGIATTLNLRADSIFVLRSVYMDRDGDPHVDLGRWSVDSDHRLTLRSGTEVPRMFSIVDAGTLRQLDLQGQPIASTLNYDLVRAAQMDPIRDSFPMRGLFTYMADSARLVECLTGKSWRVAQKVDYLALERAYTGGNNAGRPALVTLEGHFAMEPRMEGTGEEEVIVVDRFIKIQDSESCDETKSSGSIVGPITGPIVGPKWTMVELNGKPVPEGVEPPTLTLSKDGRATGTAGCNNLMGTFTMNSDGLRFGRTATTRKMCPSPAMEVEAAFLALLEAKTQSRVNGKTLELLGTNGVLAKFTTP